MSFKALVSFLEAFIKRNLYYLSVSVSTTLGPDSPDPNKWFVTPHFCHISFFGSRSDAQGFNPSALQCKAIHVG